MGSFSQIYYLTRNAVLKSVFNFPSLWWFLQNFINRHFLCTVVGIIRDDQGRILLLDHRYRNEPSALPAGFMKKGESPFDSIVRELKEETNFDIIPQRIINVNSSANRSALEFIISAFYKSGDFIPNKEIDNYSWVDESEIHSTIEKLTTKSH
ncbi:MAG TPA: NUDIX hydrolase [Ignavibacteriaceae bacterium]|nr:NUDIX hydrolase [Ignavibacteriaceae bacterium]